MLTKLAIITVTFMSHDSVDDIATGYKLDARRVGVGAPVGSRISTSP
jgi:hypothetical protein